MNVPDQKKHAIHLKVVLWEEQNQDIANTLQDQGVIAK